MELVLPGGIPLVRRNFYAVIIPDEGADTIISQWGSTLGSAFRCIMGPSSPPAQAIPCQEVATSSRELELLLSQPGPDVIWVQLKEEWFAGDPEHALRMGDLTRDLARTATLVAQIAKPGPAFMGLTTQADRLIRIVPTPAGRNPCIRG